MVEVMAVKRRKTKLMEEGERREGGEEEESRKGNDAER